MNIFLHDVIEVVVLKRGWVLVSGMPEVEPIILMPESWQELPEHIKSDVKELINILARLYVKPDLAVIAEVSIYGRMYTITSALFSKEWFISIRYDTTAGFIVYIDAVKDVWPRDGEVVVYGTDYKWDATEITEDLLEDVEKYAGPLVLLEDSFPPAYSGLWPDSLYTMIDMLSELSLPRFIYEDVFTYWLLKWLHVL